MYKCHVLIVEDDADLRETLHEILTLKGYRCGTAAHGREAFDYLDQFRDVNVILLDLMMPVMSGWEFLRAMEDNHQLPEKPTVVITSAVADLSELAQHYQCPILQKPVELAELLGLIEQICAGITR